MKADILFVPAFPRSETINHFLLRIARSQFGRTLEHQCKLLLRSSRHSLDGVPCSVHSFCEVFNYEYGDERRVLTEHTLENFYCCGLPHSRIEAFHDRLVGKKHGPIRPARLPLLFTPGEGQFLRCPVCDENNLNTQGVAIAYREHAAPFVCVCPWHESRLTSANVDGTIFDSRCGGRSCNQLQASYEFARRVANCVAIPWANSPYYRQAVLTKLTQAKWFDENLRCHTSKLVSAFQRKFHQAFTDERLQCLCSTDKYLLSAIKALVRPDRHMHATWCVLLGWFADEAENSSYKAKPITQSDAKHDLDESVITEALRSQGTLSRAAKKLKIDTSTFAALARRYGLKFSKRPKHIFGADIERIAAFIAKGATVKETAEQCGVSQATIYRVLLAKPAAKEAAAKKNIRLRVQVEREKWTKALDLHPELTVTEVRKATASTWTYLYRHDRHWLNAQQRSSVGQKRREKSASHPYPPQLLEIAKNALETAAHQCTCLATPPVHPSMYRLRKKTGLSEYAFNKLVPLLGHLPQALREGRVSFVEQRFKWALQQDMGFSKPLKPWRIAQIAKLRLASIEPFIANSSFFVPSNGVEVSNVSKPVSKLNSVLRSSRNPER